MTVYEILRKKRFLGELSESEIKSFIAGVSSGNVDNAQIGAFLMAVCCVGMNAKETSALTFAMRDSGDKLDLSFIDKPRIDKHSTGGVGDKVSIILVPVLMACDIAVPMISGRGLGHTGGTVDKMESILGMRTMYSNEEATELFRKNHAFMIAQSDRIAPADKILYSIRDVTGTVESNALITASILSKKLVEDINGLVMDMKVGKGAFMKNLDMARDLALTMKGVADELGLPFKALFTNMNAPLGNNIGNWLEIEETIDILEGDNVSDLRLLTVEIASDMIMMARGAENRLAAVKMAENAIDSGRAYEMFEKMVAAQGGNINESIAHYQNIPDCNIIADRSGYITEIEPYQVGLSVIELGGGRKVASDTIDPSAGIVFCKKAGDRVEKGEIIAECYSRKVNPADIAPMIAQSIVIGEEKPLPEPLILDSL